MNTYKQLTVGELDEINKRVDEIERVLDLCTDADWDVAQNLTWELNALIDQIEGSLRLAQRERLRLVA